MKPSELCGLVELRGPGRLARCRSTADLHEAALRKLPQAVADFIDGGSGSEVTLRRNRVALQGAHIVPRAAGGVAQVDLGRTVLGRRLTVPFLFGPTGFTGVVRPHGELLVSRAAAHQRVTYVASGCASTTPLAQLAPDADLWLNLYPLRDDRLMLARMQAAQDRGIETLVLTVDVPVAGARLRDLRNGLALPPRVRPRTILDGARHPRWTGRFLTAPAIEIADLDLGDEPLVSTTEFPRLFRHDFDWSYVAWVAAHWHGPLVLKGLLHPDDMHHAATAGARAAVISNHGGRQLDGAPSSFEVLAACLDAAPEGLEVLIDSGFRTGSEIVAALALGARAVLVGRPYLHGLAAFGQAGVERAAEILRDEIERTLHLAGVRSVDGLTPKQINVCVDSPPRPS